MRLSELHTGEKGVIVKVMGRGAFRKRIIEMGFIRGKEVDVIQNAPLKDPIHYSYDQLLDALEFIGNDYHKFIEIFNEQLKSLYKINTDKTYFDCTNFYFEIDKEDDFRRKGPSKENSQL